MKIRIKTIIDIIVVISFSIIILISISAITINHIRIAELRTVIQMKDVQIEALITSCKMDWLIKQRRPDLEDRE